MTTIVLFFTNTLALIVALYFCIKNRKLERQIEEFQEQLDKNNMTVEFLNQILAKKKIKKKSDGSSGFFNLFEK